MKLLKLVLVVPLMMINSTSARAATYEYDWFGGQPGYEGKLFLDAPSSTLAPNGATIADILPGSYVTSPFATFTVLDAQAEATFGGPMGWTPTQITLMSVFFDPPQPLGYSIPVLGLARADPGGPSSDLATIGLLPNGSYVTYSQDTDYSGAWMAVPVPEPSAGRLFVFGVASGAVCWTRRGTNHFKTPGRRR